MHFPAGEDKSMRARTMVALALLTSAAGFPLSAPAEPLSLQSPPRAARETAPSDPLVRDLYPQRTPAGQGPNFVAPLSRETSSGRMGVAGWTLQPVPTGSRLSSDPDNSGWLAGGFAMALGRAPKQRQTN